MRNILFYTTIVIIIIFSYGHVISEDKTLIKDVEFVNIELSDIRNDLELWELGQINDYSNEFKSKLAKSILRKVMLIRTLNVDVNQITGEHLETLCLLTEEKNKDLLLHSGDNQLASLANKYLFSIKDIVRKRISNLQKTMKGKGCYITPQ